MAREKKTDREGKRAEGKTEAERGQDRRSESKSRINQRENVAEKRGRDERRGQ